MTSSTHYDRQERGAGADYERYLAGMDASMQQKVALTAAHVLGQGWVADMGMGSGTGSEALAALYPTIRVTGVDINPEMVERAAARYHHPNLDFRAGDIGRPCFEPSSLDAIFDSSVLHHVTTFNDYSHQEARVALEHQVAQLRPHGCLIVRDFVRPADGELLLDLPLVTAPLFRRFAQEFRFLKPLSERGFAYQEIVGARDGWCRFRCQHVHAVEFVLRKDYQSDWETEILEEYTYFTQAEFEQNFRQLGLRILASTPLWNPWIVNNRFKNQFAFHTLEGEPLDFPPTNYLIVGEKVDLGQGVHFQVQAPQEPLNFLEFTCYEHKTLGNIRELVRRPNTTVDILPYFVQKDELFVLARKSYPRPLLSLCEDRLDGGLSPTYVTEPVTVIQGDKPLAQTVEEALGRWAGLDSENLLEFTEGSISYPSPGGVQEEIRSLFVQVTPTMVNTSSARDRVRAIEAGQLLRAAQVGGLPDTRLETHCFELMRHLGRSTGPWIGESIRLGETSAQTTPETTTLAKLLGQKRRRAYRSSSRRVDFLSLSCHQFRELNAKGETIRDVTLEYVIPTSTSLNTVAVAALWKCQGVVYLGVMDEDLPAAQCFSGHSNHLQSPAWRLPTLVKNQEQAGKFIVEALYRESGIRVRDTFQLGGAYFPSPGVTPEIAYPWAVDVWGQEPGATYPLFWVPLENLVNGFHHLKEGHLRTLVSRAHRALECVVSIS